jgi:hypothetical protein
MKLLAELVDVRGSEEVRQTTLFAALMLMHYSLGDTPTPYPSLRLPFATLSEGPWVYKMSLLPVSRVARPSGLFRLFITSPTAQPVRPASLVPRLPYSLEGLVVMPLTAGLAASAFDLAKASVIVSCLGWAVASSSNGA